MKLFYWSPFLSNIATVDAVTNSINSLGKYDKNNKYKTFIIDSTGEWQEKLVKKKPGWNDVLHRASKMPGAKVKPFSV